MKKNDEFHAQRSFFRNEGSRHMMRGAMIKLIAFLTMLEIISDKMWVDLEEDEMTDRIRLALRNKDS